LDIFTRPKQALKNLAFGTLKDSHFAVAFFQMPVLRNDSGGKKNFLHGYTALPALLVKNTRSPPGIWRSGIIRHCFCPLARHASKRNVPRGTSSEMNRHVRPREPGGGREALGIERVKSNQE
jgi:hypothetical protein